MMANRHDDEQIAMSYPRLSSADVYRDDPYASPITATRAEHIPLQQSPPPLEHSMSSKSAEHDLHLGYTTRSSPTAAQPASRRRFESPDWQDVVILLLAVAASWCLGQFAPPRWASGTTLTISRLVVALIGLAIGAMCGYALLLRIGKRMYSAIIFGTLTQVEMALHQVDKCAEPGPISALHLLQFRVSNRQYTKAEREARRPWTWCLLYFLFIFALSNSAAFIYGRAVVIKTAPEPQFDRFHPIPVLGELTADDLSYATLIGPFFDDFLTTWTLSSFAAIRVPSNIIHDVNGTDVSFTEATGALFSNSSVGGAASAWKAFLNQSTGVSADSLTYAVKNTIASSDSSLETVPVSVVYPTWGSRVACTVARQGKMSIDVDATGAASIAAEVSLFDGLIENVGADSSLKSNIKLDATGQTRTGTFSNNGVTTSFFSQTLDSGAGGNGYVTYDFILTRLNTSAAPYGSFFTTSPGLSGSTIGVDAALCLTHISPFVVRAIDSAGVVSIVEVLASASSISDITLPSAEALTPLFTNPTQSLSSTNKSRAYFNAFENSRNQILKDNGRDFFYVSNPTAVTMTSFSLQANVTPQAYGTLDPRALERVMNSMNARFLLPYLSGKGRVEGRAYVYAVKATAIVHLPWLGLLMGLILVGGLIGAFCIPKLPGNLPMRESAPSSWMALSGSMQNQTQQHVPPLRHSGETWRKSKLRYSTMNPLPH